MSKYQYRTEQSDNGKWWYTIRYTSEDVEGQIVGDRFAVKRSAMDQTSEYRKVKSNG